MKQFIRRKPGEELKADCLVQTVKHPPSVMIWGSISASGPGPLFFVEGTMRQDQYLNILKNVFLPSIQDIRDAGSCYYFMQDNAPCHTAKTVKNFMAEENIPLLPWPGNSPDINPIENIWRLLKIKINKLPNPNIQLLKKI